MTAPRWCVAAALWVLLLACAGGSSPSRIHEYTLIGGDVGPAAAADLGSEGSHGDLTFRLAEVSAPSWLTGDSIYYRLLYHDADRIAAYAESRWVAPAPQMLGALVAQALDRGGAWKAVIGPGDDAAADVTLSLQLLDLVQEFTSPSQSHGVLRVRATLTDERTRALIAQRGFDYRVEAASPDAAGGVQAEREASDRLARDVAAWAGNPSKQPTGSPANDPLPESNLGR